MFFELIRIAIGQQERLRSTPTAEEWKEAYDLAQRQTLTGIAFCGVQRLPEEQRPPRQLLMKWYMAAEQIRRKNEQMDRRTLAVANKFAEEGFPGVVLKGQGVAQLYRVEQIEKSKSKIEDGHPEGDARENENKNNNENDNENLGIGKFSILNSQFLIKEYRTPGDIDIWLFGERKDILRYVRRHVPDCKPVYHHVDFPVIEGLPIEVHFTPSWMNSPFTNRRLQRWFKQLTIDNSQLTIDNSQFTISSGAASLNHQPSSIDLDLSCQRDNTEFRHDDACCARVGLPDGNCPPRLGGRAEERSDRAEGVYSTQKQLYENVNVLGLAEGFAIDENNSQLTISSGAASHNPQPSTIIHQPSKSAASFTGTEGASMIPTPTLAFNRVYILVHIYRHLFHEGIGLRQLLDYYFVLRQGFTEEERTETMRTLRSLRMQRFTAAVMWVLQEVFAMDDRYLLTDPNEEEGRFLLSEIMLAGNFGHYDERIKRSAKVTEWGLFCRRVGRNLRFLRSYPSEVLWSPFFKLWHAVFRFAAVNRNRGLLVNRTGGAG
ncbi:MAG: nucleotidyltransferase family protein [Paludibacteraceae bacterium]|nr:nucleotidyltransferase family protein [Paludibacteraceae bacterium]